MLQRLFAKALNYHAEPNEAADQIAIPIRKELGFATRWAALPAGVSISDKDLVIYPSVDHLFQCIWFIIAINKDEDAPIFQMMLDFQSKIGKTKGRQIVVALAGIN